MIVYGVALLAFCTLFGIYLGDVLGIFIGVEANVGGVGIAMLLLLLLSNLSHTKFNLSTDTQARILFWSAMFRDFAIVATAFGADLEAIKKAGLVGSFSVVFGVILSFVVGAVVAIGFGYTDPVAITTIGAGAATYIVGPVTGTALGADSDVIALSVAAGLIKSVMVMVGTAFVAPRIGLDNPKSAMIYGGLMGTTSGVAAGLAATDPKLVPYGAMTATFYTGVGCLLCPSILFLVVRALTS